MHMIGLDKQKAESPKCCLLSGWRRCPFHTLVPFGTKYDLWHEPALLFLDGHSSRSSLVALEWLVLNNVIAVTIPAHTSHVLQPMDTGVNGVFKSSLARYKRIPHNATRPEKRTKILEASLHALHDCTFPAVIRDAWRSSGLWPWNPNKVLNDCDAVCTNMMAKKLQHGAKVATRRKSCNTELERS